MTDINELKTAIKDILQSNGSLNKIRAEIREQIYKAIETEDIPKPKVPEENLLINELIKEYFNYMGYNHSTSVFLAESGHPEEAPIDRPFISKELNIIEDKESKSIPLLYSLIYSLKKEEYMPNIYTKNNLNDNFNNTNLNNNFNKYYNNDLKNNTVFNNTENPKPIEYNN